MADGESEQINCIQSNQPPFLRHTFDLVSFPTGELSLPSCKVSMLNPLMDWNWDNRTNPWQRNNRYNYLGKSNVCCRWVFGSSPRSKVSFDSERWSHRKFTPSSIFLQLFSSFFCPSYFSLSLLSSLLISLSSFFFRLKERKRLREGDSLPARLISLCCSPLQVMVISTQ